MHDRLQLLFNCKKINKMFADPSDDFEGQGSMDHFFDDSNDAAASRGYSNSDSKPLGGGRRNG